MGNETKIAKLIDDVDATESGLEFESAHTLDEEWQSIIDDLKETEKGRRALRDPELQKFYLENSLKMQTIDSAVERGIINSENLSYSDARSMYYSYPSLITMRGRENTLGVIAEVGERELRDLKRYDPRAYLIRSRRLASIYEELSALSASGAESKQHEARAIELNLTVSESSLSLPTSPRKLHAAFSLYDMYFRSNRGALSDEEYYLAQFGFHKDLASALRQTRLSDQNKEAISGGFGELLVLGRLRGIAEEEGRLDELDISQSFIRQDSSNTQGSASPDWRWAFDLKIENLTSGELTPIEVKKRLVASRLTSEVGKYLPLVKVMMFRLGRSKKEYLQIAENYSEGMAKIYSDESPSREEINAINDFHSKVDEPLRKLILTA